MNGIIFDFDGVLVDSMPVHYNAWKSSFDEICSLYVDERSIYLLEGMRGIDIVMEIFRKFNYTETSKAEAVIKRKDSIFRSSISTIKPYEGTAEIENKLTCIKGIVSGSARDDVVIVVLNNSPLTSEDFDRNMIEDFCLETKDIAEPLNHWCNDNKLKRVPIR